MIGPKSEEKNHNISYVNTSFMLYIQNITINKSQIKIIDNTVQFNYITNYLFSYYLQIFLISLNFSNFNVKLHFS